jgi:hypothetical protein
MILQRAVLSIAALSAILCGSVVGQDQDESERTLQQIYKYLNRDLKSRYFANPVLFVGEITALGPVFHGVCKQAVNQTVDFAVSELLVGDLTDDVFHYGYPNCTLQSLPSPPFTLHSQVILFCHHRLCREPVPATPERLQKLRTWMAEARRPEDDAAFSQLKATINKAKPLRQNTDLIFEGEIAHIQPIGSGLCTIARGRETEITVLHILFGEPTKGPILADYGSINCPIPLPLSVRRHAKVILYCALQLPVPQARLTPVEDSPERLAEAASWITAATTGAPSQSQSRPDATTH